MLYTVSQEFQNPVYSSLFIIIPLILNYATSLDCKILSQHAINTKYKLLIVEQSRKLNINHIILIINILFLQNSISSGNLHLLDAAAPYERKARKENYLYLHGLQLLYLDLCWGKNTFSCPSPFQSQHSYRLID